MDTRSLRVVESEMLPNPDEDFILYWMRAHRRTTWNHALDRAVDWAIKLHKPLLIVETLSIDQWACDCFHSFALQGMVDNADACGRSSVAYYPFLESKPGETVNLLAAISESACVVVTDDFPLRLESRE